MARDARTSTPNVHAVWRGKNEMKCSFKKKRPGKPGLKFMGMYATGQMEPHLNNECPTTRAVSSAFRGILCLYFPGQ